MRIKNFSYEVEHIYIYISEYIPVSQLLELARRCVKFLLQMLPEVPPTVLWSLLTAALPQLSSPQLFSVIQR